MYRAYCGVGSRETPDDICQLMTNFAAQVCALGWTLRSGGAEKADKAFEAGVDVSYRKEIYLPWGAFSGSKSMLFPPSSVAMEMASKIHPNWDACSEGAKKLHARNIHQVLGQKLNDPVKFLICWTKGGQHVGGTATALRVAGMYQVPIFNLGDPNMDEQTLEKIVVGL